MTVSLLDVNETAKRLSLSPLTIRGWIFKKRLPVVRIGRAVRIREEDLEALVRFGYEPLRRSQQ